MCSTSAIVQLQCLVAPILSLFLSFCRATQSTQPPRNATAKNRMQLILAYLAGGVDGAEVAEDGGVLLEGVDDGGLAAPPHHEVLERPQLPRLLHRIRELCKNITPKNQTRSRIRRAITHAATKRRGENRAYASGELTHGVG